MLANYLKITSKMCYGLTTVQTRELAYQFALSNKIDVPYWEPAKAASKHWLQGFMRRHNELSIRKPENTSLSRATSFNRHNIAMFFDKLENVYQKKKFQPHMIWNIDETGCSTVTNPPKIIATRGSKQVGQITSAERGNLVTMVGFVNASGGTLPPVFIFPRVHFKEIMLSKGPKGSLGLANPSGWINEDLFIETFKHFLKFVKPADDAPCLLLMDNHSSHLTLEVVILARQNNVTILTLPPHCSHRLQPLDVSVYGPFKARYKSAMNNWMLTNPGKTVTIYEVAEFANEAHLLGFSPTNIVNGFRKTGIHPFNRDVFTDDEFLTSFVTDRCEMDTPAIGPSCESTPSLQLSAIPGSSVETCDIPDSSRQQDLSTPSTSTEVLVTPESIRPLPKAGKRKSCGKSKKCTSTIITDTPEKEKLMAKKVSKNKQVKSKKKAVVVSKNRKRKYSSSSNSSSSSNISLHDTDDSEGPIDEIFEMLPEDIKKRNQASKKNENLSSSKENCMCPVCNKRYANSKEDWLMCKICEIWAHDSCGVKGTINFFCKKCF
jgi:hypothetical protein